MLAGKGAATGSMTCLRSRNLGLRETPSRVIARVASPSARATVSTNEDLAVVRDSSGRLARRGPTTAEDIRDFNTLFSSLLKEYAYEVDESWVTGTIPPELYGTYYRNGPGLQVDNPRYRRHTFDGDGMVLSLAFRDGKAYFRNRFVRTEGFVKEQEAGRLLFRNSFTRGSADGSPFFNPFDLSFKNVANTGVFAWAGKLYALWEGGLPYAMDPKTLDTLGESRLGDAVRSSSFGAHYRVTSEPDGSRRWVGFSNEAGWGSTAITFYEFAENGALLHETKHELKGVSFSLIHDMLVSEHYYIIVLGPAEFDAGKFATRYVLGRCSIAECLVYNRAKPAKVVLVPRPGRPSGKALSAKVLETRPCFVFHHVNAFEVEREGPVGEPLVVLDSVALDEVAFDVNQYTYGPEYYNGGSRSHLVRFVCDPAAGTVQPHRLMRRTAEFPAVDTRYTARPYRYMWAGADMLDDPVLWGPNQAIVGLQVDPTFGLPGGPHLRPGGGGGGGVDEGDDAAADAALLRSPEGVPPGVKLDLWYAGERRYTGEPLFVPRPGSREEGDGWLLVAVHDVATQKGELVILDARDLSSGPLATLRLPHRLPAGLHGSWDGAFAGPDEAEVGTGRPKWQELGTIRQM